MGDNLNEGYYCLMIAILKNVDSTTARLLYQYGVHESKYKKKKRQKKTKT